MLSRVVLRFFRSCSHHFRANSSHLSERNKCLKVQRRRVPVNWKGCAYIITVMTENGCPKTNVVSGVPYLSLSLLLYRLHQAMCSGYSLDFYSDGTLSDTQLGRRLSCYVQKFTSVYPDECQAKSLIRAKSLLKEPALQNYKESHSVRQ